MTYYQMMVAILDITPFNELFFVDHDSGSNLIAQPNFSGPDGIQITQDDVSAISESRSDSQAATWFFVYPRAGALHNQISLKMVAESSVGFANAREEFNCRESVYGWRKMQVEWSVPRRTESLWSGRMSNNVGLDIQANVTANTSQFDQQVNRAKEKVSAQSTTAATRKADPSVKAEQEALAKLKAASLRTTREVKAEMQRIFREQVSDAQAQEVQADFKRRASRSSMMRRFGSFSEAMSPSALGEFGSQQQGMRW